MRTATALSAPFFGIALVLAAAGVAKLLQPAAATTMLHSLWPPAGRPVIARALGILELSGAAWSASGARGAAALVSALFVAFSLTSVASLRRGADAPSCGCFGSASGHMHPVHVALNVAFAATAGIAAVAGTPSLGDLVDGSPLKTVTLLLAAVCLAYLAYAAMSILPELEARFGAPPPAKRSTPFQIHMVSGS